MFSKYPWSFAVGVGQIIAYHFLLDMRQCKFCHKSHFLWYLMCEIHIVCCSNSYSQFRDSIPFLFVKSWIQFLWERALKREKSVVKAIFSWTPRLWPWLLLFMTDDFYWMIRSINGLSSALRTGILGHNCSEPQIAASCGSLVRGKSWGCSFSCSPGWSRALVSRRNSLFDSDFTGIS